MSETESEFEAESLQVSSEPSSDAVSDQDDFNASEDEGSESDFEESDGKVFQLRLWHRPIILTITFKAKTGMSWRGKLRSVRQTWFSRILQVTTNWPNSTADKKRVDGGRGKGDDSDDSDRPKKKAPAKSKSQGKPAANGRGKR
jgi:hypothetical protein